MQVWTDLCDRKCSYTAKNNFGQICATGNARVAGNNFMQVWTDLCDRKCSYAAGNDFMQVCAGKLSCSWKPFYVSLDKSVEQEVLLCRWKPLYASLDESVRQEMLLCVLTVSRNSILNFPA